MNRQFFACIGTFSFALVTALSFGGWMPGEGGSWPLMLAIGAAAGALAGPGTRLQAPKEFWRNGS